jgi:class 3 adenylate cyclase/tetratricopeptide (TPR) repeat protein
MHRKVVTVLFCDVVGSTSLGESSDPEALQGLLARYFERMKAIVDGHGGSVEKFIGDAVMAVFGVPAAHEDDALRATHAALEMLAALPELGIKGRIGVNTGEVVTDTGERLATGDAVNVAARLQQAAAPDEILIGQATLDLTQGLAEVETVGPLDLKGKSEPVPAFRLLSIRGVQARRHEPRFVGRERELASIAAAWERARTEQRCELFSIVGDAGVGKSRLVAEAMASIDAPVLRGRCLPYGEGITYWPVVEVLKQLDALPTDVAAAAAIRSLLGESDQATSAEEIAWAVRKLFEQEAPLVVVLDDIQWGEETFLDLVEGVSLFSSGAPILFVCLARPELLDRRPHWPVTFRLEPLGDGAVDELIGEQVPPEFRVRIARAAGGNPLFLTEMLAMAASSGDIDVPPTLRALLAARLDQLDEAERSVLERGAVEGEVFHRGAVQALAPEETQITPRLAALVRRELIRPDQAQFPGDDGFRFRHLLIRDAAYDSLPKSIRAELHDRFAAWLEEHGADLVELDEIVGYHLEQAARYKLELGQPDPVLAERAGRRLAGAGRRALWRSDEPAAAVLLERALVLTRPHRLDIYLELDLADAFWRTDVQRSVLVADAAVGRAREAGDGVAELVARVVAARHGTRVGDKSIDELELVAREALPVFEQADDHDGLLHIWRGLTRAAAMRGHYGEAQAATERALAYSRRTGWPPLSGPSTGLPGALTLGPEPADSALRTLDAWLPDAPHPRTLLFRALLLAMLARFDIAVPLADEAGARLKERSGDHGGFALAGVASLAGDHETAAHHLRAYCDFLREHNHRSHLSTYAPQLGWELCALNRHEEAENLAQLGRELGYEHDIHTQLMWRRVQALVHARRGEHTEADRLAREAISIVDRTDMLNLQGDARCDLAAVLASAGRTEEAAAVLEQALERYEEKQNLAMSAQVRARLADLDALAL